MNNIIKILLIPLLYLSLFPTILYAQWIAQNSGTNQNLYDVEFMNENTGWAVGGASKILFTETGGSITGIQTISTEIPSRFELKQNYPNPFNAQTTIEFNIPKQGIYNLEVFSILERKELEIFNEIFSAGSYSVNLYMNNFSSGTYIYRLEGNNNSLSNTFTLIK